MINTFSKSVKAGQRNRPGIWKFPAWAGRSYSLGLVEKFIMLLRVAWRSVLPLHFNFYIYIIYSSFIIEATSFRKEL